MSKRKLRTDDKFRIQENIHRKTRRKLPEVGERTKITDRKSKQKLTTYDKFRIQENIHRKTRRKLPEVGERTKITERMSKENLEQMINLGLVRIYTRKLEEHYLKLQKE